MANLKNATFSRTGASVNQSIQTLFLSPPMRHRASASTTTASSLPDLEFLRRPFYPHVSKYRSSKLELQFYSPSLKVHDSGDREPIAVVSQRDQIDGEISLDPSCYHAGRLNVVIEGSFSYQPPSNWDKPQTDPSSLGPQKHVFLSETMIGIPNVESSSSISVLRDAFARRQPSIPDVTSTASTAKTSHRFTFQLPRSKRPGEELPPTFVSTNEPSSLDYFDVTYRIIVDWEPNDPNEMPSRLEVPFLVQPDVEFHCIDASVALPVSWFEMPLKAERPMPVRCAITLPTSLTFSRASSIPYFVVFTTTPRSTELAKEIAADSTICVSLIRQIIIADQTLPSPTSLSDGTEFSARTRFLHRIVKSQPRRSRPRRTTSEGDIPMNLGKSLPRIPTDSRSFSDSRTIVKDLCIGFPKRPRLQCGKHSHPSLETIAALPDGLHKTRISLDKDMLPCIDWAGVSVKYYLDVSVLLGPDTLRGLIPIRIF